MPGVLEDSDSVFCVFRNRRGGHLRLGKTPAQVLLAWAVQRGTALLTTPKTAARAQENFDIAALPEDALEEINGIQTRQRLNEVVKTGVQGFIARSTSA